jgi:hypothetical protein
VKIMFASLGAYGHLYPMMPLALACAEADHEVVIATGEPFLQRLSLTTVPGYPQHLELDWVIRESRRRHPDLHADEFILATFADVLAEKVAPTMIEQCQRLRPDLVIYEGYRRGRGSQCVGHSRRRVRDRTDDHVLHRLAFDDGRLPARRLAEAGLYAARAERLARGYHDQSDAAEYRAGRDAGSDDSDQIRCLQRVQCWCTGVVSVSAYPATHVPDPWHGVVRGGRGAEPGDQ